MDSPVIVDKASEFGEPIDLDHPFPGFPFDDEGFGRRSDIRAHLDDLAARHPEFADHLLGPPWGDIPFQSSFRNRNHHRGSGNGYQPQQQQQQQQGYSDEDARSQASGSSATSGASVGSHGEPESNQYQQPNHRSHDSEHTPKKNQIPQYGLRNTVDIGQHHHNMENPDKGNRGQRSMSAPPENRQSSNQQQPRQEQQTQQQPTGQRYVSRIDITPQHNQPQHQQQQQQPQQQQSQKPQQQQGNVRHIPIFVEGRDEPVLPRSFDEQSNFRREPSPTQFHAPPPHFQRSSPFGDVFAGRHQWSPHFQDTFYQQPTSAFEHPSRRQQQQQPHSFQQSRKPQQQNYEQAKSQQKPRQQSPQAQQQQQEPPPAKPKPTVPKDPLERVALIQKEIDSLAEQVKQYNGNSRTDKQYIYLDEMLTRQLIKLDDIETEGRDNVRQARKNAIKTIQETIGLLESKAPLPSQQTPSNEQEEQDKQLSTDADNSGQITDSMDIDQRPEDQTSNKDATTTTATTTTTTTTTNTNTEQPEVTEADRKTTEIQSKEPIPLPPPCPSSEEKSCTNDADHRTLEMDVAPSQTPSEPMDTGSTEKSKPTDSQQTASTEEVVEVEKPSNTVDETSKKPEDEAEQRKSDKGDANKTDTSEEMKKEETEKEKKSRQQEEEQQRQKGDEKMDVDNEVKQSPKTQKKGKKTKKQQTATTSDKPIPLPAPESTADSNK